MKSLRSQFAVQPIAKRKLCWQRKEGETFANSKWGLRTQCAGSKWQIKHSLTLGLRVYSFAKPKANQNYSNHCGHLELPWRLTKGLSRPLGRRVGKGRKTSSNILEIPSFPHFRGTFVGLFKPRRPPHFSDFAGISGTKGLNDCCKAVKSIASRSAHRLGRPRKGCSEHTVGIVLQIKDHSSQCFQVPDWIEFGSCGSPKMRDFLAIKRRFSLRLKRT